MNRAAARLPTLLLVAVAATARAQNTAPPGEPPDPRRGERLDGRPAPEDPLRHPRAVGRAILAVPRWLIEALLWPGIQIAGLIEEHHLLARTYWALTTEDRLIGLRPEAHYETGFIASVGVRFFDRRSLGRGSLVQLRVRSGGPRFIFGELRVRAPHESRLSVQLRSQIERDASRLFSGTHGESRDELAAEGRGEAKYGLERATNGGELLWQVSDSFRLALEGELDVRNYHSTASLDELYCAEPGTPSCVTVDEALVPGIVQGLRLLRPRAGAVLDTRQRGRGRGGVRLAADGAIAKGILGDRSAHATLLADAQLALDLSDHTLIIRLNGGLVAPLGDAPVPFEELLSASGSEGLRGVSYGRLRGHSKLVGTLEYRWLLAPYLDAALFFDYGGAFDSGFKNLSFGRMTPSFGFGLHVKRIASDYWRAAPLVSVEIAGAPDEGTRLSINLGFRD